MYMTHENNGMTVETIGGVGAVTTTASDVGALSRKVLIVLETL